MPLEINENKRKLATVLFTRGSEAIKANNFDYAVDCFLKCTNFVPDNLLYRQHLRATARKKYKDNGKGGSAGLSGATTRMALRSAKARKKWQEAIELAETLLTFNPWDVDAQLDICAACKELLPEMSDTGHWVATAAAANKDRADALINLADWCELRNNFTQAINALELARKLDPDNTDLPSRIRRLGAQETIDKGKYEENVAGSESGSGEAPKNTPRVQAAPQETPEQKALREIKELEGDASKDPTNSILHIQVGDAYRRMGLFNQAAKAYDNGHKACGNDPELRLRFLDVFAEGLKEKLEEAQAARGKLDKKSPDYMSRLAAMDKDIARIEATIGKAELESLRVRIKLSGDDLNAQLELGRRLRIAAEDTGKPELLDEAIPYLQNARKDIRNKWRAQFELGQVFFQKKNYPLADKSFADAEQSAPALNETVKCEILYWRGRGAEARKDAEAATDFYNQVAAIDYSFADVALRLEALTNGGGKEADPDPES